MFTFAFFIGLYSYVIFYLGFMHLLTTSNIATATIVWFIALFMSRKEEMLGCFKKIISIKPQMRKIFMSPIFWIAFLIFLQAVVNFIGALGPELAFDALWYHLTLPKMYLLHQAIYHIPGGLLYYSDMPKLGEMLYTGALATGNEITAKIIHFSFGLLILIALYKMSRKFFTPFISFLAVIIFYSNLVVDWESITAYIDLIRTFFEILALWGFIEWSEKQQWRWLVISAVMTGFAIATKVLAFGSLFIFSILLVWSSFEMYFQGVDGFKIIRNTLSALFIYWLIAVIIPLPWFIFSYIHTGNPVYPFFSHLYLVHPNSLNLREIILDLWNLFMYSSDPLSPLYLIFFPLLFVTFSHFSKTLKMIIWYCVVSLLFWYIVPQTGGGRFILPYLPAFSLICAAIYSEILKKSRIEWKYISKVLIIAIVFVSFISIGYRVVANKKYIPIIFGAESKQTFLSQQLNFSYGDFYDTDNYFAEHIKSTDTVLLYGFHNLYYINFPFTDSSWVKKGNAFTYIAVQNGKLPSRFANWQSVYKNDKTMVQLYKPPKGICHSICYY